VFRFLDSVSFRNDTNSSIDCVFLRDQIEPLFIHNYIMCRRNCTVVRGRKLVTIAENWMGVKEEQAKAEDVQNNCFFVFDVLTC
jgi:hypothetical protein